MRSVTKLLQIAISILILCAAFSCSPEKRLARLVKNHPELVSSDTVFRIDTTVVNGVQHDTTFVNRFSTDTITIVDKQLTIKYVNDGKRVYLKGKCDTVFVTKEMPVSVNTITPVKEVHVLKWWDYAAYVLSIIFLICVIVFIRKR